MKSRLIPVVLTVLIAAGLVSTPATAQPASSTPTTIPALTGWQSATGFFELGKHSRIVTQQAVYDEATTFAGDLEELTGRRLPVVRGGAVNAGDLRISLDPRDDLGAEGYELTVGKTVDITAKTDAGAFYGTRTVLQLLHAGSRVPAGHVVDVPSYAERGVGVCACVINVSMAWFERLVKDAAYLKLNQLWVELKVKSDTHPESVEWGYYTKAQIAALQRLADRYHVTIVPEVNSPGHIDPWIRNRPDLQLTDSSGVKQVSRLDITKPEAFEFLTDVSDETLSVVRTPYWHMGADEYMLGSDYARYPQLLAYAREKFGPNAVPQDAYVDFINRINAHVKAMGKTLRIWNDGITTAATVPLDNDIVVEHWLGSGVRPSALLAQGRKVMNAAYGLYNVRGGFKSNTQQLYTSGWTPTHFDGETVADRNGITGAKITLWPDNGAGNTENEIEAEVRMPLRFIAQATWGTSQPDPDYAAFTARADAVGRAPGFGNVDRTPVARGTYSLSVGHEFLGGDSEGAQLALSRIESAWDVTPTADGYYTLTNLASGRCAESRLGTRYLNTPLEPGTAITAQTCDATNRLQRWQLSKSGHRITLVNAITRMVATFNGSGLVQQLPDGHSPTPFTLTPVVRSTAAVDQQTIIPGTSATLTVTVTNTTTSVASVVSVTPVVLTGWSVTPANQSAGTLRPGETTNQLFAVTPPPDAPASTVALGAVTSYRQGGSTHTLATTAGLRLSCVPAASSPVAVTYVDSEETAGEDGRAVNAIDAK